MASHWLLPRFERVAPLQFTIVSFSIYVRSCVHRLRGAELAADADRADERAALAARLLPRHVAGTSASCSLVRLLPFVVCPSQCA